MELHNQTANMSSIRTDDNGDFVLDITVQGHIGCLTLPYEDDIIDGLTEWLHNRYNISKRIARQFLDYIHKNGRDKLVEKIFEDADSDKDFLNFECEIIKPKRTSDVLQTLTNKTWGVEFYEKK